MIHFPLADRFLRLAGRLPLLAFALLAACSSSDKRPLVLVIVPVSDYPGAQTVIVDVTVPGTDVAELSVDLSPGTAGATAAGHYGVYLAAGTSGNATVSVSVRDRSSCELASGGMSDVPVTPGNTSGPVAILLAQSAIPCNPDGGPGLDALPAFDVGTVTEAAGYDLQVGRDGGTIDTVVPDGILADREVGPGDADDARMPDVVSPTEVGGDVAQDLPGADAEEVGPTTASVFRNCNSYTHLESGSAPVGFSGVLQLIFTPDGKNLVSYGQDGRAKVWSVTATGLTEPSSELVFTGAGGLYGAISPDGKYVAIGGTDATVRIFDLSRSLSEGAAVSLWTLPPTTLPTLPYSIDAAVFTKDLKHIIVGYYNGSTSDDNYLAIWELGTSPKILQTFPLGASQRVWMGVPGDSPASAWIATRGSSDTGTGDPDVVAVLEISPTSVARADATVSGYVTDLVLSPDGKNVAVGLSDGQVLLYDFTNKSELVLQSPPLLAEATSSFTMIYGMAFTRDEKYFAAGIYNLDSSNSSVRLLPVATRQSTEKALKYMPLAVAFAPSGLGLAVGEDEGGTILYCTP